uniref:Uncharacterized protein n=1 Tax=Thermosporothrix sp. COM3 TaxID=2490863 RepID=A0A455STN3_9CHLR|nr:hypothetical protein KTC_65340 [Thermosporothrix sp. COM3]
MLSEKHMAVNIAQNGASCLTLPYITIKGGSREERILMVLQANDVLLPACFAGVTGFALRRQRQAWRRAYAENRM